jgi:hypothetical protein
MTGMYAASWLLIALWTGVAILGGTLAFYSFRSGRRTGDRSMILLGVGFVLLSLATAAEWFGVWLVYDDLFMASLGCTALMAMGFGVMFAALRMRVA